MLTKMLMKTPPVSRRGVDHMSFAKSWLWSATSP